MLTTNHDTTQASGHVFADPERFFDADYTPILHQMISRIEHFKIDWSHIRRS